MSDNEKFCGHYHAAVYQDNVNTRRYVAFPLRCKSWECPSCRKIKAENYKKRIKKLFDGRKLWFYTLTFKHNNTPQEAWCSYNAAWNRLRTNLRKKYGSFEYVRVLESHENSPYPHLHIITDKQFPVSKFGYSAVAAGFGHQIRIKPISGAGAASYITKYLTKEWKNEEGWNLRKTYRCRIISFSSGLLSPENRGGSWSLVTRCLGLECALESIRADFMWRLDVDARITHELLHENNAEITVVFSPVSPGL